MSNCFAGLDWASRTHAVCVIDERGSVRVQFEVAHDAAGLTELVRRLRTAGVSAVAIERPSGLIVDALVEARLCVVPIHPNIVKATRPRYRSHGGKSDATDAYLLADLLRTDGHRFKPLACQSDEIRALRALVRGRDDLVATRVQLANQLRSLLQSFWPGAAEVFAEVDSPIALAFVKRYPTPESASRLGPRRMAGFCGQHGYSGRRSPEELLQRLHQAAAVALGELEMEAKGELALSLVRTLSPLVEQIRVLTSRIEHDVGSFDDGKLIMSFPRAGRVCAAQIVCEIGSVRERFDSDEHLAGEAGVAPVTYASGKSKAVAFRWACNHRLRAALTCLADNSRHASAWAADVYDRAMARGCDHPHATRILARAWLRVIWRAWQDRKPYDPTQHRAAVMLLKTAGG
ncbi:MAG: IS110 family transposase [Burkholderiaceae bacterium]|nr:MAG: IS110 family transposase [Dokdonella sp.]MBE7425168.1 IS110 family transposase [Ideonella sp.]MCC7287446.1 IS110 family transposase [Burkholderiaceae bacterium]